MATKKKITRKELKKPDEFVSKTTELYRYALENWRFFAAGLIVIALVIGGGFLWHRHKIQRETTAFSLYHKIYLRTQAKNPKVKTPDGKLCKEWDLLEKRYPETPAAIYGLLQESSCFLMHRDIKDCEATTQTLLANAATPGVVRFLSLLLKGYALEEKKAYAGAEKVFKGLLNDPNNFLKDTVLYHLFICQLRQGKKAAAKKTLSSLKVGGDTDLALPVILVKIQKARLGIKE